MAATYKPSDAIDYAKTMVKRMPIDDATNLIMYPMADYIHSIMWMAAPWRWTVGYGGTATVTSAASDYTIGSFPSDFLYIESAYLTNGEMTNDLEPVAFIPNDSTNKGVPSQICYLGSSQVRINPKPPSTYSWTLYFNYKKTRTKITSFNYGSAGALVMDDEWFWVYQAGVLWQAYLYADDARAGAAQANDEGKINYTGQLGVFQAGLTEMRNSEYLLWKYSAEKRGRG